MGESVKRVHRGFVESVYVQVDKLRDEAQKQPPEKSNRGIGVEELEDSTYVFGKKGVTFYDLGTRRNEDGSYADITPGHLIAPTTHTDIWNYFHNMLLGGVDFAADRTCLQLPQAAENLYIDASFVPTIFNLEEDLEAQLERNLIGNIPSRTYVSKLLTSEIVQKTDWKNARLPYRSGSPYFYIEGGIYFNSFIAANENFMLFDNFYYMVTNQPSDLAENIPFALKSKDKVYLVPILTLVSSGTTPNHLRFARRIPILSNFSNEMLVALGEVLDTFVDGGRMVLQLRMTSTLSNAIQTYYTANLDVLSNIITTLGGVPERNFPSMSVDRFAKTYNIPPRSYLAAVIVRNEQRFYIWRNYTSGIVDFLYPQFPFAYRRYTDILN